MSQPEILVSVLMPTFNHSEYIRQAIDSFLAQEGIGAESAELLVGNDASTDNTAEILEMYLQKYPDRIKVFNHATNKGIIENYKFLIEHSQAKYLAILESDDYWTDPMKLHKQITFMQENPHCGVVFTSGKFVDEEGKLLGIKKEREGFLFGNTGSCSNGAGTVNPLFDKVLFSNPILAVTACFRRETFDRYCNMEDYVSLKFVTFDYPVWISLAWGSSFYAMADITSSYRVGAKSVSNNSNYAKREKFMEGIDSIIYYSVEKFGYKGNLQALKNERIVKHMMLALAFGKMDRYNFLCRQINPRVGVKWMVLRYIPFLFRLRKRKIVGTGALSPLSVNG